MARANNIVTVKSSFFMLVNHAKEFWKSVHTGVVSSFIIFSQSLKWLQLLQEIKSLIENW